MATRHWLRTISFGTRTNWLQTPNLKCVAIGRKGISRACYEAWNIIRHRLWKTSGDDHYSRSNCTLALWIWSGDNGDFTHDYSQELQVVRSCLGVTPVPSQCVHWTQGIAGTGGTAITSVQVGAVNRFVAVNWVGGPSGSSYDWNTSPPEGIVALAPVLYEGSATYNPASLVGCSSAYPSGGYDC